MDWITRIFGLMTPILMFYVCGFKQGHDVLATNTIDPVGYVHNEDENVWDKNTRNRMNKQYVAPLTLLLNGTGVPCLFNNTKKFQHMLWNTTVAKNLRYSVIQPFNHKEHNGEYNLTASQNGTNRVGVRQGHLRFLFTSMFTHFPNKFSFAKHIASSGVMPRFKTAPSTYIKSRYRIIRSSDIFARSRTARNSDVISRSGNDRFAGVMSCGHDEFQCYYDGACISKLTVCDRNVDCFWYEKDESDCSETECPAGAFRCKSGECLSYIHRCNRDSKCWDNSDEVGCHISTCPPHYYRCNNGQCIELKKRCDGNNFMIAETILKSPISEPTTTITEKYWSRDSDGNYIYSDCLDGSDEWNCGNYTCPVEHFQCKNGQCVSMSARCDHNTSERFNSIQDCNDGSDEEDCEVSKCGDYFRCFDGQCLHPSGRCDNVAQCNDSSDEKDCHLNNATCPQHLFSCGPGHCVPYVYRCTGRTTNMYNNVNNHCPSDILVLEALCPLSKCPNGYFRCRTGQCMHYDICNKQDNVHFCDQITDPIDHCGLTDCPRDYFRCENGHCLHHVSVCDSVPDCPGGEDETHCGRSECREYQVDCRDGNCIPTALKCDGYKHCQHGQDETNCGLSINTIRGVFRCSKSTPFVNVKDIESCSFFCPEECTCVNGLIDCSSPAFVFNGVLDNLHNSTWPFRGPVPVATFPIFNDFIIPVLRIYSIVLSNSSLTSVPLGALRFTPYVQILNLSHNALTYLRYGDFISLYRLSLIDVSYNQIHTIDDFTFRGLRVFHLNLENNFIQNFGSDLFGGLAVDGIIRSDAFILCCIKPSHLPFQNCFPGADIFSSCDDLMRHLQFRTLLWIIGLFAFIGNIGVTVKRLVNTRRNTRTRYGFFVVNLHISDCLMGIYLLIIAIADVTFRGRYIYEDENWRESIMCTLAGILSVISNESSPMLSLLITVDRYLGVKYPFGEKRVSFRTSIALTTCAWVLSAFLAVVPLIFTGFFRGEFYSSSVVCLAIPLSTRLITGWQYSTAIYVLFNSLLFMFILIGQVAIMREICVAKSKTMGRSQINEIKVAKSLMLIVLTDFLCWCPVCILISLSLAGVNMTQDVYSWVLILVLPVNAALNPILCTLMIGQS